MNIQPFRFGRHKPGAVLRPRYVLALFLALALLLTASSLLEYRRGKREVVHLLEDRGRSLLRSIGEAGAGILTASEEVEYLLGDRLSGELLLLAEMDRRAHLGGNDLRRLAERLGIESLSLVDRRGRVLASTADRQSASATAAVAADLLSAGEGLPPDEVTIIPPEDERAVGGYYLFLAAADAGRVLAAALSREAVTDLRRRIGIGSLIERLRDGDIIYIALQDTLGIIAATSNVEGFPRVRSDPFLGAVLDGRRIDSRSLAFGDGEEVLEVVGPLQWEGEPVGLLRVGLSLESFRELVRRSRRRLIIFTVVLLGLGVIVLNGIILFQNYDLTSRAFRHLQTYTGTVLAEMKDGVVVVDAEGRITLANRAAMGLLDLAGDVVGRESTRTLPPPLSDLRRLIPPGERIGNWSGRIGVESDRELYLRVGVTGLDRDAGGAGSVVALLEDVTEERRMELSLRQKERVRLLGELVAGVAHEVRNPLNAIGIYVQRLARSFRPGDGAAEFDRSISTIKGEIERLDGILTRFLGFVRAGPPEKAEVDLAALVDETLGLIRSTFERRGVELVTRVDSPLPVNGDPASLKQVLLNLLINAGEASPAGGKVEIEGRRSGGKIHLTVLDRGPGLPHEDRERIFDFFYTTKETGTGLGLSLAQGIVMDHGGSLSAGNRDDGPGAAMTVSIPEAGKAGDSNA